MAGTDAFRLDGIYAADGYVRGVSRTNGTVVLQVGPPSEPRAVALTPEKVRDLARLLLELIGEDDRLHSSEEQTLTNEPEDFREFSMPIYLDDEQRGRIEALAAARKVLTREDGAPSLTRSDQLDVARFILTGYSSSSGERMA